MDKEKFYDEEIAPVLLGLAEKCGEKGLSFVAACEYAPEEVGHTFSIAKDASFDVHLANAAVKAAGNVDVLYFAIKRYADKYGHSSAILRLIGGDT